MEMPWRIMIFVLFLALGDRASAMLKFAGAFTIFFGVELRGTRKKLALVEAFREHSFGFLQARAFVNEAMIEWWIFKNSGHRLPLVVFAQCLINVGLLEERGGVLCFDGPLVAQVNTLYCKLADSKIDCRLTVEVFLLIVFNMTIGTPEMYQTVPRAIWSSCFWGSDSQSKAPLLTLLFDSYARLTCDDAHATALAERAFRAGDTVPEVVIDELNAIVSSAAFTETLDRGYPDADIKASRDTNHDTLTQFSADLGRVWEFMGWA